jgi:hypothetical protein
MEPPDFEGSQEAQNIHSSSSVWKAVKGKKAKLSNEITLRKGQKVSSSAQPREDGWLFVETQNGKFSGWYPVAFLELDDVPKNKKRRKRHAKVVYNQQEFEAFSVWEGIHPTPIEQVNGRTMRHNWDKPEATWCFFFAASAENDVALLRRLTLIVYFHPNLRGYVKRNLGPTRRWWGECYFAWVFTRGVQFSNIVELWFLSLKEHLAKGRPVPVLGLLKLMQDTVEGRLDFEHRLAGVKQEVVALPALISAAKDLGFGQVISAVEYFVGNDVKSKQQILLSVGFPYF